MIDLAKYVDECNFDHDVESPFGCEHEGCDADVIAGWWEHTGSRLGVLGCEVGHLEIYEHHERVGRNLCWNCWERPAVTEWGSADGHFTDGGHCSRSCSGHDKPHRIVRLVFKLCNASGERRFDILCKLVDEVSLLGSGEAANEAEEDT